MSIQNLLIQICFSAFFGLSFMPQPNTNAGFTEAIYDAQTIQALLSRTNCDGIRFYNTLNEGSVELIVISTSNRADMNNELLFQKPYIVSKGIAENVILTDSLTKDEARKVCEALHLSEHTQYAADFSRTGIQTLLSNEFANAVRIKPIVTEVGLTMQLEVVNMNQGIVQDLGEGADFDLTSTEPCPTLCGSLDGYVYSHE